MSDNFYLGNIAYRFFMIVEVIFVLIANVVSGEFFWQAEVGVTCVFLIGMLIMGHLQKKKIISERNYCKVHVVLYLILSMTLCHIIDNGYIFFILLFVQVVLTFVFQDKGLCAFQAGLSVITVLALRLAGFPYISKAPSWMECFFEVVALLTATWILFNLIKNFQFQTRKNYEQERSLDDLLKVVAAKCDEARQAAISKSTFLSNMSHEIRTPINAVLGMNEMILRESKEQEIIDYALNIKNAGNMLLSLINDILDFSKIESGRMELVPVEYQLNSVMNDLVNMIMPRVKEKDLQLKVEAEASIPNYLYGDEVRIRQIITNLLTNAVKYTDEGQITLKIDYKYIDGKKLDLIVSVKDTGKGIKQEDMEKLFQSFVRLDQKKNQNIEGTGLGLSITSSFVEMMGGTINVESEYGVGSVFTVSIPQTITKEIEMGDYGKQSEKEIREYDNYKESFHAPEAKVLIVDDNAMNLKVAINLLKRTKVQVDTASGGMECLNLLRKKQYDILLLDHMMPAMDGVETLKRMRQEGLGIGMPVIALTANAVSGAREMYLKYGFQDYLSKPIVGKSLENMLYDWLPKERLIADESIEKPVDETVGEINQKEDNSFIDQEIGMRYCANSSEMYYEMLEAYLEQREKYLTSLNKYYDSEDWDNYRIAIHALKSTSLSIGAVALSEEAKALEMAAKEKRINEIQKGNEEFLQHYDKVLSEAEHLLASKEVKS